MLRSLAAAFLFASTAVLSLAAPAAAETQTAIFAGGCFWCVESDFDHVPGVTSTTSGYTGGHVKDPTYQQVVTETTGHRESEKIEFDTSKMTEIFRAHPEFATSLLRVTSLKQRVVAIRLKHLASREPQDRIMELLTRLEEMFAIDHPKGRLLVTHVTHEQIATMTGTSRVTVTRTLQRLREQNRIDTFDGHILLKRRPDPG